MRQGTVDDSCLLLIVTNDKVVGDMTNRQTMYKATVSLQNTYELVLHHMNRITWSECVGLETLQLQDDRIKYLKSERIVRDLNLNFKINELFNVHYTRPTLEPKLFFFQMLGLSLLDIVQHR